MDEILNAGIHHYVSHALLIARLSLNEGNTVEADEQREFLIKKLESIAESEEKDEIKQCLDILKNIDWYSLKNVNSFHEEYTEIHGRAKK